MSKNDERKYDILNAIIRDYIETAEPVGSRTLEKKYDLGVSSATIRNEMSDLEELGYLVQPHASAGRIPTTAGYRFYVDRFMKAEPLPDNLAADVKAQYDAYIGELNELMQKSAELLTKLTNYTSLVAAPDSSVLELRELHLIHIEAERVLMVLVTKQGIVKNAEIHLSAIPTLSQLEHVSNFINTFKDLNEDYQRVSLLKGFDVLDRMEQKILSEIVPAIGMLMRSASKTRVYQSGITEILNYPEFRDTGRAKQILDLLHEQEVISMLLAEHSEAGVDIKIGAENELDELNDCSIVTATYKLNGMPIGSVGLVGPTRMDYDKCVSVLETLTSALSEYVNKSMGGTE